MVIVVAVTVIMVSLLWAESCVHAGKVADERYRELFNEKFGCGNENEK